MSRWPGRSCLQLIFFGIVWGFFSAKVAAAGQWPFFEVQLKGELVCPPAVVEGLGVLALTEDRALSLVNFEGTLVRQWILPRFGQGPIRSGGGLVYLPLRDGRMVCASAKGDIVWIADLGINLTEARWWVDVGGRLIIRLAGLERIFRPNGQLLAERPAKADPVTTMAPGPALVAEVRSSGGGYQVVVQQPEEDFSYTGTAVLSFTTRDDTMGVLAWGDSQWKLGVKRFPARATATPRPDANEAQRNQIRTIIATYFDHGEDGARGGLAYWNDLISTGEDPDFYPQIGWEILNQSGSIRISNGLLLVLAPEFETIFARCLGTEQLPILRRWLDLHPQDFGMGVRILMGVGIDPQGILLSWGIGRLVNQNLPSDIGSLNLLTLATSLLKPSWPTALTGAANGWQSTLARLKKSN